MGYVLAIFKFFVSALRSIKNYVNVTPSSLCIQTFWYRPLIGRATKKGTKNLGDKLPDCVNTSPPCVHTYTTYFTNDGQGRGEKKFSRPFSPPSKTALTISRMVVKSVWVICCLRFCS